MRRLVKEYPALCAILGVSWLLRVRLCVLGGALYWSDCNRFSQSFKIVNLAFHGHLGAALDTFLVIAMHPGFIVVGLPIAVVHSAVVILSGLPSRWPSFVDTMYVTGAMLSLASVANIALVHALALKLKAPRREALTAAFLTACANSMFYYARFNLPYDFSLMFCLAGLWLGLEERPSARRLLLCGAVLGFGFLTHYAHWTIVGVVTLVLILNGRPAPREMLRRTALLAVSGPSWLFLLTALTMMRGITPYVIEMRDFFRHGVHDLIYGVYSEGWSLPWAYFWSAEHGLLLVWLAACAFCARERKLNRGAFWALIALGLYAVIALGSNVLQISCAYGRLARQMTPFFCLATAFAAERLSARARSVAAVLVVLQAAANFVPPLRQKFPYEVLKEVDARYGEIDQACTIWTGDPVPETDTGTKPVVLLNARDFYPVISALRAPQGEELERWPHPLSYKPHQYEGYKPAERELLDSTDIAMRVLRREPTAAPAPKTP